MARSLGEETRDRARFRGVTWDEKPRAPLYGPGEVHRALFGAPRTRTDGDFPGSGETIGAVVFHDALFVPGSAGDRPYAEDVLTVHHKQYYNERGRGGGPNDYDDPNPVSFLTVKPGARFLLALSGAPEWTDFALRELLGALVEWGVGGKTAAGYGRIEREARAEPAKRAPGPVEAFHAWLERGDPRPPQREVLEAFRREWLPRRGDIPVGDRNAIGIALRKEINSKKLSAQRDAVLVEWLA
jgi:CRISPR-associated protein Cmr6